MSFVITYDPGSGLREWVPGSVQETPAKAWNSVGVYAKEEDLRLEKVIADRISIPATETIGQMGDGTCTECQGSGWYAGEPCQSCNVTGGY